MIQRVREVKKNAGSSESRKNWDDGRALMVDFYVGNEFGGRGKSEHGRGMLGYP